MNNITTKTENFKTNCSSKKDLSEFSVESVKNLLKNNLNNNSKEIYNKIFLNNKVRTKIIDWMIKTSYKLELNFIALMTAINLFDLYLSKIINFNKEEWNIAAAISIYCSSKMEEIQPLNLKDIEIKIFKKKYTINYLKVFEIKFLNILDFKIDSNLILENINYFINMKHLEENLKLNKNLIKKLKENLYYLLKIVIHDMSILKKYSSLEISVSLFYLSLKMLEKIANFNIKFYIKEIVSELNLNKNIILGITKEIYNLTININNIYKVENFKKYYI